MGTILIVEDDEDLRELFAEVLRTERHRVLCASNGQEALALIDEASPCLVLLDLMMPVMSGNEVLAQLAESKRLDRLPVVVVSAVADQATTPGAQRCMQKPIELDALLELAREFCRERGREHNPS